MSSNQISLFHRIGSDVTRNCILSYFDPNYADDCISILNLSKTCKFLNRNNKLNEITGKARQTLTITRRPFNNYEYPKEYEQAMRKCGYSIKKFPVLSIQDPVSDYISSIQPDQMNYPIMILRDDRGRFGFALKVRSIADPSKVSVLTLHQRNINRKHFAYEWTDSNQDLTTAYRAFYGHDNFEPCEHCPFQDSLKPDFIIRLLNNEDPVLELDGDLPEKQDFSCKWSFGNVALTAFSVGVSLSALWAAFSSSASS